MGIFARLKKTKKGANNAVPPLDEKHISPSMLDPTGDQLESRIVASEIALDVMADAIYRSTWPYGWFNGAVVDSDSWTGEIITGVTILSSDNSARSCPAQHPGFARFEEAITVLNARVAIKIMCKAVDVIMSTIM